MDTEREQVFSINARVYFDTETVYSNMTEGTIATYKKISSISSECFNRSQGLDSMCIY